LLDNFFTPATVAVVGASREPGKVGHDVTKNLIDAEFAGKVYPINPKAREVLGIEAYPSVLDVPDDIDLAIIAVPSQLVPRVMREIGEKRIPAVVIISAGFRESGVEGAALEREVAQICREMSIRALGPNCLGLINTHHNLNASFAATMPRVGNIAFFSQSGALCTAILDWAVGAEVGFSKFISLGNKMDLDEVELLNALAEDPATDVILGYIEGVKDGRAFLEAARRASTKKPVIIAKSGGTAAGARAASSHTGSLAGSEQAFRAAFHQANIIRANTVQELFDFALGFSYRKPPEGQSVAIVTNAGGPGIIAADAVERSSLSMATFSKETVDKLREALPPTAAFYNPVDVIGDADAERYRTAVAEVLKDPHVHSLLVILTPQAMTEEEETARAIAELAKNTEKTILTSFMGGPGVREAVKILNEARIPNYEFPEQAINTLDAMSRYKAGTARGWKAPPRLECNRKRAGELIELATRDGRMNITDAEAREIIAQYGFTTPRGRIAKSASEAVEVGHEVGYPLVMKIASPDILHKSDIGGVVVGVSGDEEVEKTFHEIMHRARRRMPEAEIWGVCVQQMVTGGKEVILGMTRDPQFGPMLMFGLGGIYVEVLKDVSFRIAPINEDDAEEMIREIRSYPLLRGVRGERPTDIEELKLCLLRLSQFAMDHPRVLELDINPLVVFPEGETAIAVDARITVQGEER